MRNKFTLIELLVVIAIIGILTSMLLPALSKARRTTMLKLGVSNMKQIAIALISYTDDNNDDFVWARNPAMADYTWDDYTSSYLGYDLSETDKQGEKPAYQSAMQILRCPLDDLERNKGSEADGYFKRTYQLNSFNWGSQRIFPIVNGDTPMKTGMIHQPVETIMVNEQSKSLNTVGDESNVAMLGADIEQVTSATVLDSTLNYNPNHHLNNYRNALLFIDGHVIIKDMRTTRANNDWLWKSQKP